MEKHKNDTTLINNYEYEGRGDLRFFGLTKDGIKMVPPTGYRMRDRAAQEFYMP